MVDEQDDATEEPAAARRDPQTDVAKEFLQKFFADHPEEVFYERQLLIWFEDGKYPGIPKDGFFHWITGRALHELRDENRISSELEELTTGTHIRFYRSNRNRFWKRDAARIKSLVQEFSTERMAKALGRQGEQMFDAALPRFKFSPIAANANSFNGREWTETKHDLDRIFERDGVHYGIEIKNTLRYIPPDEFELKLRMCRFLGLRPLFIARMAPKDYVNTISAAGGFYLILKWQLYPFGAEELAERVRAQLRLPVDVPAQIADGTIQRVLNWHTKKLKTPVSPEAPT
ncbi:MAG TPA: hypothetical protein VEL79_08505 [Vicinamibacterales bacterium]|nr:hypothetical protein [Vicinamibacterales bacterium]